jgi:hypothetical protein
VNALVLLVMLLLINEAAGFQEFTVTACAKNKLLNNVPAW